MTASPYYIVVLVSHRTGEAKGYYGDCSYADPEEGGPRFGFVARLENAEKYLTREAAERLVAKSLNAVFDFYDGDVREVTQ